MDLDRYKKVLLDLEQELNSEIVRTKNDGRDARTGDVEDPIDYVNTSEQTATEFQVSAIESGMLEHVRAALQRIDAGTYGTCLDCGQPIPPARLDAIPWALYCVSDQEKHDKAAEEEPLLDS